MKVNTMRQVDKWIGVPLCFLLSLFSGLKKIAKKTLHPSRSRKILFIQMSEMGSIILAYELFKRVQEEYPNSELYFLTFSDNRYAVDILGLFPQENIVTISSKRLFPFLFSTLKTLRTLRKKKIDLAFDLELFSRYTALLNYLSGAKQRIGYHPFHMEGLYRGDLLTHKVPLNPHIHMSHNFLNLFCALKSDPEEKPRPKYSLPKKSFSPPKIVISSEEIHNLEKKLISENPKVRQSEKIILINPNASERIPIRRWPLENYIALSRLLLEDNDVFLIITGVASEKKDADLLCRQVPSDRCLNMAGKTSFSELMALYHMGDILISNDSGPVHFSSLTNIQTFVFFGPETPILYGPKGQNAHVFYADFSCSPCVSAYNHRRSPCRDNKCLQAIEVHDVYKEVMKHI